MKWEKDEMPAPKDGFIAPAAYRQVELEPVLIRPMTRKEIRKWHIKRAVYFGVACFVVVAVVLINTFN